jgi:hypothetical protein
MQGSAGDLAADAPAWPWVACLASLAGWQPTVTTSTA